MIPSLWSSIYVSVLSLLTFVQPNPGALEAAPTNPPPVYPWEVRWLIWVVVIGILLAVVYGLTSFHDSGRPKDVPPHRV